MEQFNDCACRERGRQASSFLGPLRLLYLLGGPGQASGGRLTSLPYPSRDRTGAYLLGQVSSVPEGEMVAKAAS